MDQFSGACNHFLDTMKEFTNEQGVLKRWTVGSPMSIGATGSDTDGGRYSKVGRRIRSE